MNAYLGYIIFFGVVLGIAFVLLAIWIVLNKFPKAKKLRNFVENLADGIVDNIPIA